MLLPKTFFLNLGHCHEFHLTQGFLTEILKKGWRKILDWSFLGLTLAGLSIQKNINNKKLSLNLRKQLSLTFLKNFSDLSKKLDCSLKLYDVRKKMPESSQKLEQKLAEFNKEPREQRDTNAKKTREKNAKKTRENNATQTRKNAMFSSWKGRILKISI